MYFVISGPQSAGKSTTIRHLSSIFTESVSFLNRTSKPVFLGEERERVGKRNNFMGAIFMTSEQERDVIAADLRRMQQLPEAGLYFDESNIFTLAHALLHGVQIDNYFRDYCLELRRLNPRILFLNVSPDISWQRRSLSYRTRVQSFPKSEQEKTLREYQAYMQGVYPQLLGIYERLHFPKLMLNTSKPQEKSLSKVVKSIDGFSSG